MCGRTSLFVSLDDLESRFESDYVADGGYHPRFNIAPHQPIEIISNEATDEFDQYTWGLLPPWADDLNDGLINARSETAHEKRSFKDAWESRPCLVLSSGFYEWQKPNGGPKQPYRIYREDDVAFAMAGLWQEWHGEDSLRSMTILTTEPNDVVEPIHNRMPVVLPESEEGRWLEAGPDERKDLCRPYPENDLDAYPISTSVNKPENDTATVIEPLGNEQSGLGEFA